MENREILRNFLSVVAGVLTGAALFMVAGFVLLLIGFSGMQRDMDDGDIAKAVNRISLFFLAAIFICSFLGGYVTARISTRRDRVHGAITGVVMAILLAYISDFSFEKEVLINYVLTIGGAMLGAWVAVKVKKRKDQPR